MAYYLIVGIIAALSLYYVQCLPINNEDSPILVHVLFRHGHRTSYRFYPTDPHLNNTFYPIGRAGLTNKGKLTAHSLGALLRKQYSKLLGDYYTPETIYVRTTDTVRTIFTAQLVVSGLWPPSGEQKWHPTLDWQPVEIITKPSAEEDLLEFYNCQLRNKIIADLPKDQTAHDTYLLPHKELINFVEEKSGLQIKDLRDLLSFYFTLKTESEVDLELPEWTKKVYPEALQNATTKTYEYLTFDPRLKSIHAGFILKKWIDDTKAKINKTLKPSDRKMFLYSAHESTLGYILTALNATKPHVPDYGSAVIVELHTKEEQHYIKVRYIRHPLEGAIEELTLPGCDTLCPLESFVKLHEGILPTTSFHELCKFVNSTST